MATQNKTAEQVKEQVKEQEQVEQTVDTAAAPEATTVVVTAPEKKHGFFRDMSVGMKIGVGLVFGGVLVGAGYLIKKVFFSGNDDPIEVDGTVTDSTAE